MNTRRLLTLAILLLWVAASQNGRGQAAFPSSKNPVRDSKIDPALKKGGNKIPRAYDDSDTTREDAPVKTKVLDNDRDLDDRPLVVTVVNDPAYGTAEVQRKLDILYTPQPDFSGTDEYRYQVCDEDNECSSAAVSILIDPVNDPPTAVEDNYSVDQDTLLQASPSQGVLVNDSDPEGSGLTSEQVSGPAHGKLSLQGDGSFSYMPDPDFQGMDEFNYQASDGAEDSNVARVTIQINSINFHPQAEDDAYSGSSNQPLNIDAPGVLANDTDPNGQPISAVLVDEPLYGILALNSDGSFTYEPGSDFTGTDSFIYRASDGLLVSNRAMVNITIEDKKVPSITWVQPVLNEEIYYAGSGTTILQVDASDDVKIASVRFIRWDSHQGQYVELGTIKSFPYQILLDIETLNMEWNQIFAIAYDHAGNASPQEFIWIYRVKNMERIVFLPSVYH